MSFLSKIFGRKSKEEMRVGGMEDFMLLIRVYYQSVIAAQLGINNLAALPDLRIFKQTYHVATVNNKLGLGEKKACKKLIQDIYGVSQEFFAEVDNSVKKHCRKVQDVQSYVAKQIHEVMNKNDWKDEGVRRTCVSVRKYQAMLGYSEAWMTEYVHTIVMLAKKEPRKNSEE